MSTSNIAALPPQAPANAAAAPAGKAEPVKSNAPAQTTADIPSRKVGGQELEQAVATLNKFVQPMAKEVTFSIDDSTDKLVVKVMDTASNKVLQQFPSEEALAMTRALDKLRGMLLKVQA